VGASGDLAPLAHLALVLVGEGETVDHVPGRDALAAHGLAPVELGAKEGLALINGTQFSTAVLALALAGAERLSRSADIAAALSIDALMGSMHPFEPRMHEPRPFCGQATAADNVLRLMSGSGINLSHLNCGRVQDAYSMRCAPQVHGAGRDALSWIRHIVTTEMNAATDNPMVFAEDGAIVSGGNFHGAPLALAADLLVLAVAQFATISERRSERLVNPALSGLPAFLTRHGGLESGLMIAQVTAAALTSEIKTLSHPASVDTIPTSANKEDHVSMSMAAGLKASRAVDLARLTLACELMCACQAIDLLAPLRSSAPLMRVHDFIRARVPIVEHDRSSSRDLAVISNMIASGDLDRACALNVN
jgi:histidine ammonia-lyase